MPGQLAQQVQGIQVVVIQLSIHLNLQLLLQKRGHHRQRSRSVRPKRAADDIFKRGSPRVAARQRLRHAEHLVSRVCVPASFGVKVAGTVEIFEGRV